MTENVHYKKTSKPKMNLRSLRLSLKYRPGLLKLILKMRQCIRKRNTLLKSLKDRLKKLESNKVDVTNTNSSSNPSFKDDTMQSVSDITQYFKNINTKAFQDSFTQTDTKVKDQVVKPNVPKEDSAWNIKENGDTEKSIAEQVKEAAQSALQENGMVYVESAGMYYDYKTGYYYNSELGLYYHTDTGCYYYYTDDKQFVFHSYPDMSKVNASLIAHQRKKARKLKRERKPEDDIENLTKHLSQDKEEDGGNPKKPKRTKKTKKEKDKKNEKKEKNTDTRKEKMEGTDEKSEEKEVKVKQKEDKIVGNGKIQGAANEKESPYDDSTEKQPATVDLTKTENEDNLPSVNKNQDDSEQSEHIDNAMDMFDNNANSDVKTKNVGDTESNYENIEDSNKSNVEIETIDQIEHKLELEAESECKNKQEETEELEDGECSETESDDSGSESDASTSTVSDEECVAMHHPPCMRVIVRETTLPKLKVGSLFLITKDGGTVGREGEQHAILLKDHNVSRNHLDIKYDVARKTYIVIDLGSKNGTILNGVRMSESQDVSLPSDILHGSTIQLGETKLLCHIHPGHTTCGKCEPGLLMEAAEEKKAAYTRTVSVKKQHELELARLKNIYAPQRLAIEEKPYNDRAQARRETVGSTNHAEKTQSSDLDTAIASENKGFKLLQKMGWSKGEGLGKESQGETEPVPLISNEGKAGLGTSGAVAPPSNKPKPRVVKNNLAAATMRLAARTKMLRPPAKAFQIEDDNDE